MKLAVLSLLLFLICSTGTYAGFNDNADGTVTDSATNLMWQKCSYGQANDALCSGAAVVLPWDSGATSAISYCEQLALGGYEDWRLPNIKELISIEDMTAFNPTIDTAFFPNTNSTGFYWTSTTYALVPSDAWVVAFGNGQTYYDLKTHTDYVRCVRGE